jgi:hypothetical protein
MRYLLSLILSVAAGIGIGLALYFLDLQGFYLIIAMPVLAGAVVGFAAALPMKRESASVPLAVIALIGGLLAMGSYWFMQYDVYHQANAPLIAGNNTPSKNEEGGSDDENKVTVGYSVEEFTTFVEEYAEVGFTISRATSASSSGIEIKDNLAYIYWGLEIVIVLITAIGTAISRKDKLKGAAA